jgi:hypothetical protein
VPLPRTVRAGLHTDAKPRPVVPAVTVPATAAPASSYYAQIWLADPAGPQRLAASNAISIAVS